MQARIVSWFSGIKAWWNDLDRRQKLTYSGTIGLIVLALVVFILVQARPAWHDVYTPRTHGDFMNFTAALDDEGIRYRSPGDSMRIQVRAQDRDRAFAAFIASGTGSATDWHWPDALDAMGMTASRSVIEQNLILNTQTRLENMLLIQNGVVAAQVELDFPRDGGMFMPSVDTPRAVATVTTNIMFDRTRGEVLANIVRSGVVGLALEDILVIDQHGNVLFSGQVGDDGDFLLQHEINALSRARLERDARNLFSHIFDTISVAAAPRFDWSVVTRVLNEWENPLGEEAGNIGPITNQTTIRSAWEGTELAGQPGMVAHDMVPTYPFGPVQAGQGSYFEQTLESVHNQMQTHFEEHGMGDLIYADSSIAVHGTINRNWYEEHFRAGYYNDDPDFMEGMSWERFREVKSRRVLMDTEPRYEEFLAAASGIPVANVMILVHEVPIFHDAPITVVPWQEIIMLSVLGMFIFLLLLMIIQRTKPVVVEDIEPELSVEDLLVSTQIDEAKELELIEEERLREIKMQQDSETKQLIERFVDSRPEAAAQLLRNWINQDWE